jgi:hypothetical protein
MRLKLAINHAESLGLVVGGMNSFTHGYDLYKNGIIVGRIYVADDSRNEPLNRQFLMNPQKRQYGMEIDFTKIPARS